MQRQYSTYVGMIILLWLIILSGCSGGSGERVCDMGETQACTCIDGSKGAQKCLDDGSGWDDCYCVMADAGFDADGDTDTDVDGDTDGDTDTDIDGDSDADSGADADGDADGDADADMDTDADVDADADADGDQDDASSDSDTDAGIVEDDGGQIDVDCDPVNCATPKIRYVSLDPGPDGSIRDGLSWNTAFGSVQEGIESAFAWAYCCGSKTQVWVAQGRYHIFQANWDDTVHLRQKVEVYGGFLGSETLLTKRDWKNNKTILDGQQEVGTMKVYHVVTGSSQAVLDGFTITNGYGAGDWDEGGGMFNRSASPTVRNCAFIGNVAEEGGAMMNFNSSPSLYNCAFIDNSATWGPGGAISNNDGSPWVENCIFINNTADWEGGGMANGGAPTVKHCVFIGNSAETGGGINNEYGASPKISDTIFSGNTASYSGGGLFDSEGATEVTNCIFDNNSAPGGGGIGNSNNSLNVASSVFVQNSASYGSAFYAADGTPTMTNCTVSQNTAGGSFGAIHGVQYSEIDVVNSILWGDTPQEISFNNAIVTVRYSDVQDGGLSGNGNIDADPQFAGCPSVSGDAWTGASYDVDTFQTVLTDSTPSWSGDVQGLFVRPKADAVGGDPRWFYIADSTSTEIRVWGDVVTLLGLGGDEAYEIYDLHLAAGSPCIDTADDAKDPATDLEGNARVDIADAGTPGTMADMGAYEH